MKSLDSIYQELLGNYDDFVAMVDKYSKMYERGKNLDIAYILAEVEKNVRDFDKANKKCIDNLTADNLLELAIALDRWELYDDIKANQ